MARHSKARKNLNAAHSVSNAQYLWWLPGRKEKTSGASEPAVHLRLWEEVQHEGHGGIPHGHWVAREVNGKDKTSAEARLQMLLGPDDLRHGHCNDTAWPFVPS